MLIDYFENEIRYHFYKLLGEDDEKYRTDYSEFIVVDGEEGDYGIIKYYYGEELIAVKTVYGGDEEGTEFTEFGKLLFNAKLINCLSKSLK